MFALALTVSAWSAFVGSAHAAVSVSSLTVNPSAPQANSHTNLTVAIGFQYSPSSDDLKNLTITLPPGLVGNPRAVPQCSASQFQADNCPSQSAVGSTSVHTEVSGVPLVSALDANGTVYNLQPQAGEPGRLGVVVRPTFPGATIDKIFLQAPIVVRPDKGYALETTISSIPRETRVAVLGLLPVTARITITQMSLTLNGQVNGQNFLTMPSSCAAANLTVLASAWDQPSPAGTRSATITPSGCGSLAFNPGFAFSTQTTRAETPTGAEAQITLPADSPSLKSAVVTLPSGMTINPSSASGLTACTDAQFGIGSNSAPACPSSSQVGTVQFDTPLLGLLSGSVYFAQPTPSRPWGLFVSIAGPGFYAKLVGNVTIDELSGRVTTTFDGLPQVPFTSFRLIFNGGNRALLTTPSSCGSAQAQAQLTPWSSANAVARGAAITVSWDGAGAACPDPRPFAPALALTLSDTGAGASPAMTLAVTRPDRDQPLRDLSVSLPPGLLGYLAMPGLDLCANGDAAAGNCPASSRVGSVTVQSGPGSAPVTLSGSVYLTQPPRPGAIAGLSVVIPAQVGPVDLGRVIVANALVLRPGDFGLDVASDPLPTMLRGIPLALRSLTITLDRPGFLRNPTRCGDLQANATIGASDGRSVQRSTSVTISGCDTLPFAPSLEGTLGSVDNVGGATLGVPLTTRIALPAGNAALKRVRVQLPGSLVPNITAISRTCPTAQVTAGTCPDTAKVGTARVVTPLLATPLEAPVLLAENPGGLPRLAVPLLGTVLYGDVSLDGGKVTTTFDNLPDIPLSSFELAIAGGPDGLLRAPQTICAPNDATAAAVLDAHSGGSVALTRALTRPDCTAPAGSSGQNTGTQGSVPPASGSGQTDRTRAQRAARRPAVRGSLVVRRGLATLTLSVRQPASLPALGRVRIVLPSLLRPTRGVRPAARAPRPLAARAVRVRGRALQIRLPRATRTLTVKLTRVRLAATVARALARRKRVTLKLPLTVVDRTGHSWRITLVVRPRGR